MIRFNRKLCSYALILLALLCFSPATQAQDAISDNQPNTISETFNALHAANWELALRLSKQTNNPLLQKYIWWRYARDESTPVSFEELSQFIAANPAWPGLKSLQSKAELQLPIEWTPNQILDFFATNKPASNYGKLRMAEALYQTGKDADAEPLLREYWQKVQLSPSDEKAIYEKYKSKLRPIDHQLHLFTLVEAESYTAARFAAKLMGKGYLALVEAQIAYNQELKSAKRLLQKVPDNLRNDPGLLLAITRNKRRNDEDNQALAFLARQPKNIPVEMAEIWWNERQNMTRRLIKDKHYTAAYDLVHRHGLESGNAYIDAEFLSGWIALQKLKRYEAAQGHFKNIYEKATSSISLARASYWLGRTYVASNHPKLATPWFLEAAKYPTSFYGQLARQYLPTDSVEQFHLPPKAVITYTERNAFDQSELVHLIKFLAANNENDAVSGFLQHLTQSATTGNQLQLLVDLALELNRRDVAVAMARQARLKGFDLIPSGFPTIALAGNVNEPEDALVYAIMRQESSFDPSAKSSAGAMGLMQLMPSVAASLSKQLRIEYRQQWLITRPEFNITLGKLLLSKEIENFDKHYAFAIAAYNAGPSRVNQWLESYGDPRKGQIDLTDWIEMIPFSETRGYVHRVLENLVIYRYLLANKAAVAG